MRFKRLFVGGVNHYPIALFDINATRFRPGHPAVDSSAPFPAGEALAAQADAIRRSCRPGQRAAACHAHQRSAVYGEIGGRQKVEMGGHWKAKESKTFQLYEIAKANLKKDATPILDENEKFSG